MMWQSGLPRGNEDRRLAHLGVAEKGVRVGGRKHRVDGHLHVAGGGVLETDGARNAGDQLPVHLALGGARADGSPGHQAGDILRRNHVEKFGAGGHAHLGQVEQQVAGQPQAVVDLVGLVEMRVVDEPLPADGGARLLEVDAHHDAQVGSEFAHGCFEQGGILARGFDVMDGTGAGQNQQAVVAPVEDVDDFAPRGEDGLRCGFAGGPFFLEKNRGQDDFRPFNANVFSECGTFRRAAP